MATGLASTIYLGVILAFPCPSPWTLSKPFFKNILAYDPFKSKNQLSQIGAIKVELVELANKSDFIVILCNLDSSTKGMIKNDFFIVENLVKANFWAKVNLRTIFATQGFLVMS